MTDRQTDIRLLISRAEDIAVVEHLFGRFGHLRAIFHPDGPDSLEALLTQVAALSEQVHPTALEVLKFVEVYLKWKISWKHLVIWS